MIIVENVPTPHGHVCIYGPDKHVAQWRWTIRQRKYEKFLMDKLEQLNYTTFIDIGAAFGYFCHHLEAAGKTCIAVEPEPFRWACLQETTGNFQRLNGSIGSGVNSPALGEMATNSRNPKDKQLIVPVYNIEDILGEYAPDTPYSDVVIKLDIEGAEFDLFKNHPELVELPVQWLIEIHEWNGDKQLILDQFEYCEHLHSGPRNDNHTYLLK